MDTADPLLSKTNNFRAYALPTGFKKLTNLSRRRKFQATRQKKTPMDIFTHSKSKGISIGAIIEDAGLMVTIISLFQHPMTMNILLALYINTRIEIIKKEVSQR